MSSPLENRFQNTSLGKDQTPYFAYEKPRREAVSGSRRPRGDARRKNCHSGKPKQGQEQNTVNTQTIRNDLFQVIPNLMLKTALINELLSFGRQFMLFTAMDQRTSSFFAAFHMRERTFFISQDIEDSSARRLKLWSKTNTEICVEP